MKVNETLELLEAFPYFKPQVFNSFPEFPGYTFQPNSYVVFVKASSVDFEGLCKLEEFAKKHKLGIKRFGSHLMLYDYAF